GAISPSLDIGFDFEFFGETYDEFKIAANGFISFDEFPDDGCCDGDPIPNNSAFEPNNAIYAIWDYFTASFSEYSYFVAGEAPNRRLVVNFLDMPICCGSTPAGSAQIILHETSNCIEIQTDYWNAQTFGSQTQGIENADGTEAFTYPGRNGTLWSSSDETYIQFCPSDSAGLIYEWSNGYIGNHAVGLEPGTYTVSATDANGCFETTSVTITAPASDLVSDLDVTNVSCFGFDDATVDPDITGGVASVVFSWNNGAASSSLTNVEPGTYSVTATDNLGCTIEVNNITVTEPDILLGSVYGVQNLICENDENGVASVSVVGGVEPYSPLWSNGTVGFTATNLSAGQHNVAITDSNGCEVFVPVSILFEFPSPQPDLGNNILSSNGAVVNLNTTPNTYAAYTWSTGETTTTIDVTETGVYWVEVTSGNGCVGSDTIYVEVWPTGVEEMNTLTGVDFYPNPARDNITFEIDSEIKDLTVSITDAKGSVVANQNFLNGGTVSMNVSNLSAGVYSLNFKSDNINATERLVIMK
ncbi:MAG: T9SS type A sorting domain-containing protein, partial [Salibacteraceae bacterium]